MLTDTDLDMIRRRALGQAPDPHGQADLDRLALLNELHALRESVNLLARHIAEGREVRPLAVHS